MVNTHNKGNRVEKLAIDKLKAEGWLCDRKNWNRYASKDFYGLFDILAVKEGDVRLIQVKSNASDFYKARKDISLWRIRNGIWIKTEVWLYKGRGVWREESI
jgi:Holliday junction resolvase-like predicted endonuclease